MRYIISFCIILYLTTRVESLTGERIISADHGEFPYIASIQHIADGQIFCSGVLITRKDVLTAAHCTKGETPQGIQIVFEQSPQAVIAPTYRVDLWLTYDDWANRSGIPRDGLTHDIANMKLIVGVIESTINPVPPSKWHKTQIQGKTVTIIGWNRDDNNNQLKKAFVKLLSDEDCVNKVRLITNRQLKFGPRILCTFATPYVLLQGGDSGAAILDKDKNLLGVNFGPCPDPQCSFANVSNAFLNNYQVNLHMSVQYYRKFISKAIIG